MDLDETFDESSASFATNDGAYEENAILLSSSQALKALDALWYAPSSKRARWMDLIGDYAGHELFILDGESLLQNVLDDPLLAIDEFGLQSLHARHSLEKMLLELRSRHANFEIVFWHEHRYPTLCLGTSQPVVPARLIARRALFNHLLQLSDSPQLDLKVRVFKSLSDAAWKELQSRTRPMFVLMNDGGSSDKLDETKAPLCLLQRRAVVDILSDGMAVALLEPIEFRNSKIFTFVIEDQRQSGKNLKLPKRISKALEETSNTLAAIEKKIFGISEPQALQKVQESRSSSVEDVLTVAAKTFASHLDESPDPGLLLYLLKVFLAHVLCAKHLPLHLRAQPCPKLDSDLKGKLSEFVRLMFLSLDKAMSSTAISLDVDRNLFIDILLIQIQYPEAELTRIVGEVVTSDVEKILRSASVPSVQYAARLASASPTREANGSAIVAAPSQDVIPVLPFENVAFDGLLPTVEEQDDDVASTQAYFHYQHRYEDNRHWHGRSTILKSHEGGEAARKASEWARRKELKKHQRNLNNMQKLAASLTGALGTQLQPKQIISAKIAHQSAKSEATKSQAPKSKGKKGKEPPMKKADMIKKQNTDKKKETEETEAMRRWSSDVDRMESRERDLQLHINKSEIDAIVARNQWPSTWYESETILYQIHTELRIWLSTPDKEGSRDAFTVSIIRKVLELCQHKPMTKTMLRCLENVLSALGFSDYMPEMTILSEARLVEDRRMRFKFIKLQRSSGEQLYDFLKITEDPIEWQLRLFGEYMDRSMDSKADHRVDFKPDGWQREVLDALDADESVLVVAPTSAGKTFISFYAMEKVLRESDDGILIYIAPTKALVNQVAAEVYARFKKDVPGNSMWAIHTRDYRLNDPQHCQILVTVPEMFAIMLLSPPLAKLWTPRIKRIILDEIHTIGQQEGGATWEQILLLAPCPIVGLSATIGSPEVFNEWLASVQEAHGFKHRFISHPYRYSHLRKHVYSLPTDPLPFRGLLQSTEDESRINFFHPVSALAFGTNTMPPDFSLEARDTLTLHKALKSLETRITGGLARVDPRTHFRKGSFMKQKNVIDYEQKLKEVLLSLMSSPENADRVTLNKLLRSLTDEGAPVADDPALNTAPSRSEFLGGLIHLLNEMYIKAALPAIFFSFDRSNIEIMATEVLRELVEAENTRKESPKWKAKLKQWEIWKTLQEKKQKAQEKTVKKRTDDDEARAAQEASSWESSFDPSAPLPEFSFADFKRYQQSELDTDFEELRRSRASIPDWALECLRRGIAVHHSGMNKGYRNLIERLFRLGYVRVMFATGTLALGINAPAKSAVFCGDSPFLTALNYRQCAGRAGRRGFDLLGNVIFYGIPMDRIQRLILSRLPILTGNFPLTSTLSLRLFNLLHGSQNSEVAVRAVRGIMKLPQISFGSPSGREQIAHHMRFSIEYLRRAGLLDVNGKPLDLFGVVAHLYHTEPSNLALVRLLRSGVLHRIAGQKSTEKAKRDLVLLLSHLFGRTYLPPAYGTQENIAKLRIEKKYSSRIVLPPLPSFINEVLEEHNKEILNIFSGYARSYVSVAKNTLGVDNELPLSRWRIGPEGNTKSVLEETILSNSLKNSAFRVTTRSLFVANSGLSDDVQSVEELARTCRRGLELNEHAIPSLSHILSSDAGDRPHLNGYLYDFYTHGQLQMLVAANGIRRGDVWYLLQDFDLALKAIRVALDQLLLEAMGKSSGTGLGGLDGELAALENDWEDDDLKEDEIVTKPMNQIEVEEEKPDTVTGEWDDDSDSDSKSSAHQHTSKSKPASNGKLQVGVSQADRKVVNLVYKVCDEFSEKFRKIFA